jgi:glutamate racemase
MPINRKQKNIIGVFDSGVGGLSVYRELKKLMPDQNYIFLADQAFVPYGEKSKAELCKRADIITRYFIKQGAKLIVIACNTSTCYSIDYLRDNFKIQFVGTVPAVKTAAEKTKNGIIAVMSTPATSKSKYLKELIKKYADSIKVINIGCKNLENKVEEGDIYSKEVIALIKKYMNPIINAEADSIVLGCTHYPFLKNRIAKIAKRKVNLIDSGRAVALRTRFLAEEMGLISSELSSEKFVTTDDKIKFSKVASKLLRRPIKADSVIL